MSACEQDAIYKEPRFGAVLVDCDIQLMLVNRAAMPDGKDLDYQHIILDEAEDAIVAHTITPFPAPIGGQSFSMCAQVIATLKILTDP